MLSKLLSFFSADWSVFLAAVTLSALGGFIAAWEWQSSRVEAAQAEHAAYVVQVEKQAAVAELEKLQTAQRWQREVDYAKEQAAKDLAKAQADTDTAAANSERLRSQLSSLRKQLSSATRSACTDAGATLGELFGECQQALRELGAAAQGHRRDVEQLQRGWASMSARGSGF